jgi:hypothetical protein
MTEIDELLERIATPPTHVADDVARGERALRRRRWWQVAAVALSVAVVAGVGVALTGSQGSPSSDPGFSEQPGSGRASSSTPAEARHDSKAHRRFLADQRAKHRAERSFLPSMGTIRGYHDVLAEHLDPHGDLLAPPSNEQGGTGVLGTKLDWNHGGLLEIVVGKTWSAAGGFYLLETAGMKPTTYDGHQARVSTAGDDTVVSVRHDDGTVVTLIASTSFGNNGTSSTTSSLTEARLLAAAADPRLTLPTAMR